MPPGKVLMLTQACVEHPETVVKVETGPNFRRDGRLTFGQRGCTTFRPAYLITAGQTLSCSNRSGLTRTCSIMGEMHPSPRAGKRRAVLIDVDAALEAEKAAAKESSEK